MRSLTLLLLLTVYVSCELSDVAFRQKIWKAIGKVKTSLNKYRLALIREKMHGMDKRTEARLALTPERKAALRKKLEEMKPIREDRINPDGDSIEEVNENAGIDELLYQGDIVLADEEAEELIEEETGIEKRQAVNFNMLPKKLWTNGVIYSFHDNATDKVKSVFRKAVNEWRKDTCIEFYEKPDATERIEVMVESGCWSYVGNQHKVQPLSLGNGCHTIGSASHELGHTIGMHHTHARHDRDEYVTIDTSNIKSTSLHNFNLETEKTNDNLGIAYDYGSIMHYKATAFSLNGSAVVIPNDVNYTETLGSRFISFNEKLMLNKHYKCLDKCDADPSSAKCKMGGYPHPRNCSKCVCPDGYGGDLCDERPSECGATLEATETTKTLIDEVGDRNSSTKRSEAREDYMKCYYWIKAPEGRKIEIKLVSFPRGFFIAGCDYAGVEIKTNEDQRQTGYRFCSPESANTTLISHSSLVPIITFNRFYITKTVLEYRLV